MKFLQDLIQDRMRVTKYLYRLDAVLGILSIAGAALYGASYSPKSGVWAAFLAVFIPFSVLWSLFCYGAYKGLTSEKLVLKVLFWVHVVGHVFAFPIGTAIAAASIWLWRDLRKVQTP